MHYIITLRYQPERDYLLSLMGTEQLPPHETPLFVSKHLWFLLASRGRLAPNYGGTAAGFNRPGCQQTNQIRRRDVL